MQHDGLVYLATPYSHPQREVRVARFDAVNRVAADLMRQGVHVYSPISHTHPIAEAGELPLGWDFWEKYDRLILSACSAMVVFCQEGWLDSKGVCAEIGIAEELGLPVQYLYPAGQRGCRGCGCTPGRACPGGCWWVDQDLCSSCAEEGIAN